MVAQGIDRGLGRLAGGLEQALAERLTPEEALRRCRAKRRHSDRAERDTRLPAASTVPLQGDDAVLGGAAAYDLSHAPRHVVLQAFARA